MLTVLGNKVLPQANCPAVMAAGIWSFIGAVALSTVLEECKVSVVQ